MYNYKEHIKEDILDHIRWNFTADEIAEKLFDRDEWEQALFDELWICDSVTGNASGSYTFNRQRAKEFVFDNIDVLEDASCDFCLDLVSVANAFLMENWEYFDVTIRCYLLGGCLSDVLDELEQDPAIPSVIPMF